MLEYRVMEKGKEWFGIIGNQLDFMELLGEAIDIMVRFPDKYHIVYAYFPRSNDGGIPLEHLDQFLIEFKEIGNEKILGNELIWENQDQSVFLPSNKIESTRLTDSIYQVINEDGFNLIMDKSDFDKESKIENKSAFYIPYVKKGSEKNFFSPEIESENPIIVFQSKSFIIRSLGNLRLYIDNEDGAKKFLFYSPDNDYGIVEHVKFCQSEILFKNFNHIYSRILEAVEEALSMNSSIEWR